MALAKQSPAEIRGIFGANLRQLCAGFASVSEVSRRLNLNRTQLNRYLAGDSFPRPDVLAQICAFFGVDARILLEPLDRLSGGADGLHGPELADFFGPSATQVLEATFPSGVYRFVRASFLCDSRFVVGLVRIWRRDGAVFLRGLEAKAAVVAQDLPVNRTTREFCGYVLHQEEGVSLHAARRGGRTGSLTYLSRVPALETTLWCGYVARTVPEAAGQRRVTRVVYEQLAPNWPALRAAARMTGYREAHELSPMHRNLLRVGAPFA